MNCLPPRCPLAPSIGYTVQYTGLDNPLSSVIRFVGNGLSACKGKSREDDHATFSKLYFISKTNRHPPVIIIFSSLGSTSLKTSFRVLAFAVKFDGNISIPKLAPSLSLAYLVLPYAPLCACRVAFSAGDACCRPRQRHHGHFSHKVNRPSFSCMRVLPVYNDFLFASSLVREIATNTSHTCVYHTGIVPAQ